jgi:hypothetical protein
MSTSVHDSMLTSKQMEWKTGNVCWIVSFFLCAICLHPRMLNITVLLMWIYYSFLTGDQWTESSMTFCNFVVSN